MSHLGGNSAGSLVGKTSAKSWRRSMMQGLFLFMRGVLVGEILQVKQWSSGSNNVKSTEEMIVTWDCFGGSGMFKEARVAKVIWLERQSIWGFQVSSQGLPRIMP